MSSQHRWVFAGFTAATVVCAVAVASPAQAAAGGTAKVSGSTVLFTAKAGATNTVLVTRSGNVVIVQDKSGIKAGSGCRAVRGVATRVRCTTSGRPKLVKLSLGDKDDVFEQGADIAVTVSGGEGNDSLDGGPKGDTLLGDAGVDILTGDAGNDILDGGLGADSMNGGSGRDLVTYATRRAAVSADLNGSTNDGESGELDSIAANVEDLVGGNGADALQGNSSKNRINGGPGDDYLFGTVGGDELSGGAGNDNIWSASGGGTLRGGPGNDSLYGFVGSDTLDGGAGNDLLWGGRGSDTLIGGTGNDTSSYATESRLVVADLDGAAHDDGAVGERDTTKADVENLVGGNDARLTGNAGNNILTGGDGTNRLTGGGGNDTLTGRGGNDTLTGGAGNDTLDGGFGADAISGGSGRDVVTYADRSEGVAVDLSRSGPVDGQEGEGDNVAADVEDVTGGSGGDYVIGTAGANRVTGGAGSDTVYGGRGADRLLGGDDDDRLFAEPSGSAGSASVADLVDGGAQNTSYPGDICFVQAGGTMQNCETTADPGD